MTSWALAYLALEWALRLVMLLYVPQRRSPAAARTWLLLIFIQPVIGGLLYAFVGRPYLSRRRAALHQRVTEVLRTWGREQFEPFAAEGAAHVPPEFAPSFALAAQLGDFPLVRGIALEWLPDYEPAIDRLIDDIDDAASHVHLLYYIFADDRTGNRVADALLRAAARGVACCVLIDSLASKGARRRLAPRLRAGGIEVRELLPIGFWRRNAARLDLRNHRKIAVIDGRVAYVGSQNLVDADFKRGLEYEELVARVTGPVVAQIQAVFLADRYYEAETADRDPRLFPAARSEGEALAQVLPSGPGFPVANNQRLIVSLIHAARRRVVITTPYFIPDDALLQALQTAVWRGAEVHLVLPEQADQLLVCQAQRSYYEELLAAGVQIHLYGRRFLHAKHATFDDQVAVVGSSNMDIRSFQLNAEVSLIVVDAGAVAALRRIEEDRMQSASRLTREAWNRRPAAVRALQNVARMVDSVL